MINKTIWSQKKVFKSFGQLSSFRGPATYSKLPAPVSASGQVVDAVEEHKSVLVVTSVKYKP